MTTKEEPQMEEEVNDPQAVLAALRAAQAEIKRISTERDELKKSVDSLKETVESDEWRNRALVAEVKSGLASRGLKDADRLIKVLGTDGIDFDENGKVTGLEERIKEASKDFPELFDPKTRAGGKADAFANQTAQPQVDPIREAVHNAVNGRD